MVERQLPKLHTRVRFPSPAPGLRRVLASFWQEFARRFKEPPRGEGVIFNKRLIFGEPGSGRCVYAVKSGQPPTPRPPNARTFSSPRFPPGAGASFVRRRQKNSRAERGSYGAS